MQVNKVITILYDYGDYYYYYYYMTIYKRKKNLLYDNGYVILLYNTTQWFALCWVII